MGGKVDGREGQERGKREGRKQSWRGVGGRGYTHASWEERHRDGAQAHLPGQPGVTEMERRSWEGKGTRRRLQRRKEDRWAGSWLHMGQNK